MSDVWDIYVGLVRDEYTPPPNHDLLGGWRGRKVELMAKRLDQLFEQNVAKINDQSNLSCEMKYHHCHELTPVDAINKANNQYGNYVNINKSTYTTYEYIFELDGVKFSIMVDIPYLDNGRTFVGGVPYFPQFAIIDRGGMYRSEDEIIIQVTCGKLFFSKGKTITFRSQREFTYSSAVLMAKLHQSGGRKRRRPPMLLYPLAEYGFYATLKEYGMEGKIDIVEAGCEMEDGFDYVKLNKSTWIKFHIEDCRHNGILDAVVSIMAIVATHKRFEPNELKGSKYYGIVLGKWTFPSKTEPGLAYKNAHNHLRSNNNLLDGMAKLQLSSLGIEADHVNDLVKEMFFNLYSWIHDYNPTDLFSKKLGSLDMMLSSIVYTFNTRVLEVINNKRGLSRDAIRSLSSINARGCKWVNGSRIFQGMSTAYNDSMLLAAGAKFFRSVDNMELGKGSSNKVPTSTYKADKSFLVVTSIGVYPSSAPIKTGYINVFMDIDEEGNIIEPPWAPNYLKNVFK